MSNDAADVIFQSGADELRLEPDGPVYRPGDVMPASFGGDQRLSLQAAGFKFFTRHVEPAPAPATMPAETPAEGESAKEQPRRAAAKE